MSRRRRRNGPWRGLGSGIAVTLGALLLYEGLKQLSEPHSDLLPALSKGEAVVGGGLVALGLYGLTT
jgi:hypothetical protein